MKPIFTEQEQDLLREIAKNPDWFSDDDIKLARLGIYMPFGDIFTYKGTGVLITGEPGHGKTTLVKKFLNEHPQNVEINSEDVAPLYCTGISKPEFFPDLLKLLSNDGKPLDVIVLLDETAGKHKVSEISYEEVRAYTLRHHWSEREPDAFEKYVNSLRFVKVFRIGKTCGYRNDADVIRTYETVRQIIDSVRIDPRAFP